MASITCSTCGEAVLDTQTECPACGTPTGFLPPEKRGWRKPLLIGAGVFVAVLIGVVIFRSGPDKPVEKPVPATAKAPQPEVVKPAPPVAKAPPREELPKPPLQEAQAPPPAPKSGVQFLAVYANELLRELRPVVSPDDSALQEITSKAASGVTLRPLGLACGPEREPYFAWAASQDAAKSAFQVGASCGNATLVGAAERAVKACRENGGCNKGDGEIQLSAADVRDGGGDRWQARPRLSCRFTAGKLAEGWQFGTEKTDFSAGCESLFSQ